MDDAKQIEKSAVRVHWATGPVLACIRHANALVNIGAALGTHVHVEPYDGDEPCINCVNEAKKHDR